MYKVVTQNELQENKEEYKNFKLCYIDEIPETYSAWDEESEKIMNSDEYKKWHEEYEKYHQEQMKEHGYHSYNPFYDNPYWNILKMKEYPNPDRENGRYFAYFTPLSLDEQWGDDWNDAPYDCNAGEPYDSVIEESKETEFGIKVASKIKEHTIIKIPFDVFGDVSFPSDYGGYNTPFCVDDINRTAVAWMYNGKDVIHAGTNPYDFVRILNEKFNQNKIED